MHHACQVTPQHQTLAQQLHRERLRLHIGHRRDGVPVGRFGGVRQGGVKHGVILLEARHLAWIDGKGNTC